MKRIYLILIMFSLLSVSCNNDEDMIFSQSSTERVNEMIQLCDETLKSAEEGWKVTYVPKPGTTGGFNILMKFLEYDRVFMDSDFVEEGTPVDTTSYSFNASEGPILCFDSYALIHQLSHPDHPDYSGKLTAGKGMEGDFEFKIQSISKDSVVFKGKKRNNHVVFYPATKDDWDGFLPQAKRSLEKLAPGSNEPFFRGLNVISGDQTAAANFIYDPITRSASVTWSDPVERKTHTFTTAVYGTRDGVGFMPAMRINDLTVEGLSYSDANGFFINSPEMQGELKFSDTPPIPFYNSFTDLRDSTNASALPLVPQFTSIIDFIYLFIYSSRVPSAYRMDYVTAMVGGLKQFKISWRNPIQSLPVDGIWLTYYGSNALAEQAQFFYNVKIKAVPLRTENDQVRFEFDNLEAGTNGDFTKNVVENWAFCKNIRNFFLSPSGFTVVPYGTSQAYFVSISDSKQYVLFDRN